MKPPAAVIFDVQRFSIHDGPGIRSLVFFKGCNLHCPWCQNPESQDVAPLISFYRSSCREEFRCAAVCAEGAILRQGYRVDHRRCTLCLDCVEACAGGALKPIGEYLEPQQLFQRLLADRAYYQSSGGGVTFSGGEPTLYPEFVEAVLELCQEHGIDAALETCGAFSLGRWQEILRRLQVIYFDLKIIDDQAHKQATGLGNERILENARFLVEHGYPVEFRLALVAGFTDAAANLEAIAGFVRELGHDEIHLLAYHRMGEAKIAIIRGPRKNSAFLSVIKTFGTVEPIFYRRIWLILV
ncbi:MAG: glycyl-radical enzyme activating protein [Rhodospirillales bacterium]|nr:glycyl-radical enzyme activating protein [Rhodospirillales bacterium]